MRTLFLLFTLAVLVSGACRAAANPALGKWDCTPTSATGATVDWMLEVVRNGDKLSAAVPFQGSSPVPLIDPRFENDILSFKLQINETEIVTLKGAIGGKRIEGTFEGHDSGKGTFSGVKRS